MFYNLKLFLRKIIPYEFILWTHKARAIAAAFYCGFPAKRLRVIGVAGTKGKTTTVNLIAHILEGAGHKVAMFSTANVRLNGAESPNMEKLTTPSPFFLQKFLRKAVKEKCDYAIVEISSHGLTQFRHWGVRYKTVVLTNMASDHLDYHKIYENYKNSHNVLITKDLENMVINYDDENLRSFLTFEGFKKYVFSLKRCKEMENIKLIKAENIVFKKEGSEFSIKTSMGEMPIRISLIGEFNVYNFLAATAAGLAENIKPIEIKKALELIKNIPGRIEKIQEGQDFTVIVDYAHSPDSLRNVYKAIKPSVKNRLIAVLGGTGDRDKSYRASAGALADQFADIVIVTNEDPYSEDPEDIMDQVLSGIKNKKLYSPGKNLFRILDRKEAIKKAVSLAVKDDVVLITGKGSEQFMIWGDKKIPWDDRKVAREALRKKFKLSGLTE